METKTLIAEHKIGQFLLTRYQKKRLRVCIKIIGFLGTADCQKLVYFSDFSLTKYFGFIDMNQTVNPDFVIFRDIFATSQAVFFSI